MQATEQQIATITKLISLLNINGSEIVSLTSDEISEVLDAPEAFTYADGQKPAHSKSADEVGALGLSVVNAALPESVEISAEQLNSLKALLTSLIETVASLESVDIDPESKSNGEEASSDAEKRTWGAVALEAGKWTAATGAGVAVGALTGGLGWVAMGVGGAVGAGALGVKRAVTAKKAVSTDSAPSMPVTPAKSGSFSCGACGTTSAKPASNMIEGEERNQDAGAKDNGNGNGGI